MTRIVIARVIESRDRRFRNKRYPSNRSRIVCSNYIEELMQQALGHRAVLHPYLQAMSKGNLPDLRGGFARFCLPL
jgi:hypothetical protein